MSDLISNYNVGSLMTGFKRSHPSIFTYFNNKCNYEGGSESSVIGVITLLIDIIGCCIMP